MKKLKILVACEESQRVTIELRKMGHTAFSCDIEPCSGGHPEWHLQGRIEAISDGYWDMIIAFPPCTHLAVSGARHFPAKIADGRQQEAVDFFMLFANHSCPKIVIENPVGVMSSKWRKPDQIVHPYWFGEEYRKRTCLWLKGVEPLVATDMVGEGEIRNGYPAWMTTKGSKKRSTTFMGIAKAMAQQWG